MVFASIFSSEKNQIQFGKMDKIQKKIFNTLLAQKYPERKKFDIIFSLKRSLQTPGKHNETMNPIVGLGHEI